MKHPYQNIASTKTHLILSVKNHLQVFTIDGTLVGSWKDPIGGDHILKKQQLEKIEKLNVDSDLTPSEDTESDPEPKRQKTDKKVKIPKIPTPGPGAPIIYNYIRAIEITSDEQYIIGITDSDKSILVFKIQFDQANCLELIKRQPFPKRPCSISVADDNTTVIIGDKFGDVYSMPISGEPIDEKDLKPILGHVSMLTDVLITEINGNQYILSSDRDEHIKVTHYPKTYLVDHWLFGHDSFVFFMLQLDFNRELLVSAGGDDSVYLWNWYKNELLSTFDMRPLILPLLTDSHLPPVRFLTEDSVREITVVKLLQFGKQLVVLLENVKALLVLNITDDFKLQLGQLFQLDYTLTDITSTGDYIIGTVDSETNELLEFFKLDNDLSIVQRDCSNIVESNPCEVKSKEEFYPLYTINTLRKRSEH